MPAPRVRDETDCRFCNDSPISHTRMPVLRFGEWMGDGPAHGDVRFGAVCEDNESVASFSGVEPDSLPSPTRGGNNFLE